MKLYLGGKMLGIPGYGFSEFDEMAKLLRAQGHEVFNPAEHDRSQGFDPGPDADGSHAEMTDSGFNRRAALRADLDWIMTESEGMVVLANWGDSYGSKAEIAAHQALYLPVWPVLPFLVLGDRAKTLDPLQPGYILSDVSTEVARQIGLWGEQRHPDGTSDKFTETANTARDDCQHYSKIGEVTWFDILSEEYWEAMAETEWPKIRTELIQSMAVMYSWIRDGDKR